MGEKTNMENIDIEEFEVNKNDNQSVEITSSDNSLSDETREQDEIHLMMKNLKDINEKKQ